MKRISRSEKQARLRRFLHRPSVEILEERLPPGDTVLSAMLGSALVASAMVSNPASQVAVAADQQYGAKTARVSSAAKYPQQTASPIAAPAIPRECVGLGTESEVARGDAYLLPEFVDNLDPLAAHDSLSDGSIPNHHPFANQFANDGDTLGGGKGRTDAASSTIHAPVRDAAPQGTPPTFTSGGGVDQALLEAVANPAAGQDQQLSNGKGGSNDGRLSPGASPRCPNVVGPGIINDHEAFTVPGNGGPAYSMGLLANGQTYTLVASGGIIVNQTGGVRGDAEYWDFTNPNNLAPDNTDVGIKVDRDPTYGLPFTPIPSYTYSPAYWGPYRPDHAYYLVGTANTLQNLSLTVRYQPSGLWLPSGKLTVDIYCGVLEPPPIPPKCCPTGKDLIDSDVSNRGGSIPDDSSQSSVRQTDGTVEMAAADLSSGGFGVGWGHTRTYTNNPNYVSNGFNGAGFVVAEQPFVVAMPGSVYAGGTYAVVSNGSTARIFTPNGQGGYNAPFFTSDQFSGSSASGFTLTDARGDQLQFSGFNTGTDYGDGQLNSFKDADGNTTTIARDSKGRVSTETQSVTVGTTMTQEQYVSTYIPSGVGMAGAGLLSKVVQQQIITVNGVPTTTIIRQALYT